MVIYNKRLPYDAEVEYLESTGTQWIETGIVPTSQLGINCLFNVTSLASSGAVYWSPIFGSDNGYGNTGLGIHIRASQIKFGQTNYSYDSFQTNTNYEFELKNGICRINNQQIFQSSNTFSGQYQMFMFANNRPNEIQTSNVKFYYCKIYNGTQLVRDFIPVRVGQTGYMYDKVSGKLFGNAGTGNFTLGQDVIRVEYIESTGTQWIDTGVVPKSTVGAKMVFSYNTADDHVILMAGGDGDNWRWGFSSITDVIQVSGINKEGNTWQNYSMPRNVIHDVEYNYDGQYSCYLDGNLIRSNIPHGDVVRTKTIWINASYTGGNAWRINSMKIYSCKIIDNGILVRDFVPIRTGQEGAMKDLVTGKIYKNGGLGDFAVGDDIIQNESRIVQITSGHGQLMPLLPCYSFGVVSDLHVNSTSNGAPEDIERMFKKFENRHISKVFCCGDITTNHTAAQLSVFTDIKDQHPGIDFYSCNGNHDVGLTDAEWQTYVGHPFKHWFMWHNDAFIFMPIDVWEGSHPYQANLDWLEGLLQDFASTRVFLFIHFPLNSNSSSFQYPGLKIGQTYGFSADSEDNAALIQMLKDHGNVIVFTGHSHYAFETQDEQVSGEQMVFFEEDGVSHVHVPSLSRPRDRSMEYIEDGHSELQPSQGLQVDVYDKFIKVCGIEFNLTVGDGRKGNDRLQNLYVGQNTLSLV